MKNRLGRRGVLAAMSALFATGCARLAATGPVSSLFEATESWNKGLHDLLGRRSALAREFSPEYLSPDFRGNGTVDPDSDQYRAHAAAGFAGWQLTVSGLVRNPL